MEVKLNLPDHCDDGAALRIFKGIELVAKRYSPDVPWEIKTVRCDYCGRCCMGKGEGWLKDSVGYDRETGYCGALIPMPGNPGKWLCGQGHNRPFACSAYGAAEGDNCCIEWKIV